MSFGKKVQVDWFKTVQFLSGGRKMGEEEGVIQENAVSLPLVRDNMNIINIAQRQAFFTTFQAAYCTTKSRSFR